MKMRLRNRPKATLVKRARRGFRGYPVATLAYYGPDDRTAIRISVGVATVEDGEMEMRRWYGRPGQNLHHDVAIHKEVLAHINARQVASVAILDKINGCACQDDDEMPAAVRCTTPCGFWEGVERPTDRLRRILYLTGDEEE